MRPGGCWTVSSVGAQVFYKHGKDSPLVTPELCNNFCNSQDSLQWTMRWFGVEKGNTCWCADIFEGIEGPAENCDAPCEGDKTQICGGKKAANVFALYASYPYPAEKLAHLEAKQAEEVYSSYSKFTGQTCGESPDSKVSVGGADTLVGSVAECKMLCSN